MHAQIKPVHLIGRTPRDLKTGVKATGHAIAFAEDLMFALQKVAAGELLDADASSR
jgi:hypothetical protein